MWKMSDRVVAVVVVVVVIVGSGGSRGEGVGTGEVAASGLGSRGGAAEDWGGIVRGGGEAWA